MHDRARTRSLTGRLLVAGLGLALLFPAAGAGEHPTLPIGSPAPAFRLKGVDGRTYTLGSFRRAKILVVIFTCNHCPTAQAYEERIIRLVADYRPKGVAFVAINPNHPASVRLDEQGYTDLDDTFASMKMRAADRHFNFPYCDDGALEAAARAYGPVATPHVFIFDDRRTLRFQGRIDDAERESLVKSSDTRNALDALLRGGEPPVRETPVFGCSIKWADKAAGNLEWLAKVGSEPVTLESADSAALRALCSGPSDRVRVVNVWATWCGPCVAEFDGLVETNLRFRQRDFALVTIAAQYPDEREGVLRFLRSHHASMRNLIFGGTDKYAMLRAIDTSWSGALPYTLVLGTRGEVLYRETGALDFLRLRRAILPALDALTPWGGLSPTR